jgi:hypothetical protein
MTLLLLPNSLPGVAAHGVSVSTVSSLSTSLSRSPSRRRPLTRGGQSSGPQLPLPRQCQGARGGQLSGPQFPLPPSSTSFELSPPCPPFGGSVVETIAVVPVCPWMDPGRGEGDVEVEKEGGRQEEEQRWIPERRVLALMKQREQWR